MELWFNSRFRLQQDTQCTYDLTLRCVKVNIVAAENQSVLNILIVCLYLSLSNTQSTCSVLYFHLWLASICGIFYIIWNKELFLKQLNT